MNTLFPVFLKTETLRFLIIGGGNVGLEKLEALLKNAPRAEITILAPMIKKEIEELSKNHNLKLIYEEYDSKYLENNEVVIAGTDSVEVNKQARIDCKKRKILINVADTPELCDFYLGSVVAKGDLKIGISTNGKSPTFAKRFREILEDVLPETIQETLDNLQTLRNKLKGDFTYKVEKLNEITKIMKKEP